MLSLFQKISNPTSNRAIISNDISYSYEELVRSSEQFASVLLDGKKIWIKQELPLW